MSDLSDFVVSAVRKHLNDRRVEVAAKFPKNLSPEEYARTCGRYEEIESTIAVMHDALRKANAQHDHPDDKDPET